MDRNKYQVMGGHKTIISLLIGTQLLFPTHYKNAFNMINHEHSNIHNQHDDTTNVHVMLMIDGAILMIFRLCYAD